MYEVFVMSLKDYWAEMGDFGVNLTSSVKELQDVLTEHYGKEVVWDDDANHSDEDVQVDVIDEIQLGSLHAVAVKLELDGNLDGLELVPESPWECDVFERLEDKLDDEGDIKHFPHILGIENAPEVFCIPVDVQTVATLQLNDDEEEEEHHHCDCGDEDCCCDEDFDDGSVDIVSLQGLRRELDVIGDALKIDKKVKLEELDEMDFGDDPLRFAKLCWYILNERVNEALKVKLPLILRLIDPEDLDGFEEDDDSEDDEELRLAE